MNEYKSKKAAVIDANDIIRCPKTFDDIHQMRFVAWANQLRARIKTIRHVTAGFMIVGAMNDCNVYFGNYVYGMTAEKLTKVEFVLVYKIETKEFTLFTNGSQPWDKCIY